MTTRLQIEGMHCDGCETSVADALREAGAATAEVDWRRGTAIVVGDDFSIDVAQAAIDRLGYRVVGVEGADQPTAAPSSTRVETTGTESADAPEGSSNDVDLLIIGSGSAAFAAAIRARELGARVVMVERGTVGGTCVNIGCVPSKALLAAAEAFYQAGHHSFAGIHTRAESVDMAALIAQKDELVTTMRREKYEELLDFYGIELIRGSARFVDADTVDVEGTSFRPFRVLVATGAAPWVPPIDGIDDVPYLTSTTALELTELPESLIVLGANAIGLELGQVFLHLGAQVTFVEALDRIAPFEEPEISAALQQRLEKEGATVLTGARAKAARVGDAGVELDVETTAGTRLVEASRLLVATGRRANTAALGLEAAGISTDERGHIVVDDTMATTNPRVYAAGDVTTVPQFVYVAAKAGNIAADNALRGTTRRLDLSTMPRVTFTSPAVASVGMTETAAREAGHAVTTSVLPLEAVPRAIVEYDTDGLIKLVADEANGRLLGAHVMARGAGDVIQSAVMAIAYRATVDEIAEMFHPYLTMAEGLKLAAQSFGKDVSHLSCCAA